MAGLNVNELKVLVEAIKLYGVGAPLQEVMLTDRYLFLQYYMKGLFTIAVELQPTSPALAYFFEGLPKRKALTKPILLFLKAHARGLRLSKIWVEESMGRVVFIQMEGAEGRECLIELQLIPRRLNVIVKSAVKSVDKSEAKSAEKSISLFPVRELPPSLSVVEGQGAQVPFDLDGYLDRWMERFKGPSPQGKGLQRQDSQRQGPQAFSAQGPSTSLGAGGSVTGSLPSELQKQEQKLRKEKLKKEQLIGKLEIDEQKMKHPWAAVGQYIIAKQSLDVPDDWKTYVDFNLPLSANIQNCFDRHKAQEKSRLQVIERINHLKQEIDELSKKLDSGDFSTAEKPIRSLASELLGKAKAKGRKKILADQVEAVFGKSAQDNMALLRKAQPWDLWVHVKDLPSAHLFIRRPRGKQVDHHLILEAARWCLENTLGKDKMITGDRYEILMTECRYVKPIKGDRLGRVNYQNESTFLLRF